MLYFFLSFTYTIVERMRYITMMEYKHETKKEIIFKEVLGWTFTTILMTALVLELYMVIIYLY